MAQKGMISTCCIDEVHATVENADSFRPEFGEAVNTMDSIIDCSKNHHPSLKIPILVMSAIFRIPDQIKFKNMIKRTPVIIIWGGMDRRSVRISISIVGDPVTSILNA